MKIRPPQRPNIVCSIWTPSTLWLSHDLENRRLRVHVMYSCMARLCPRFFTNVVVLASRVIRLHVAYILQSARWSISTAMLE